jgi:hypothetical protein
VLQASGAALVQVLGPEAVLGQGDQEVVRTLRDAFADAWKSPVAILILDDLERLLGFTVGPPSTLACSALYWGIHSHTHREGLV